MKPAASDSRQQYMPVTVEEHQAQGIDRIDQMGVLDLWVDMQISGQYQDRRKNTLERPKGYRHADNIAIGALSASGMPLRGASEDSRGRARPTALPSRFLIDHHRAFPRDSFDTPVRGLRLAPIAMAHGEHRNR